MVIRTQIDFSRKIDEVGVIALPYLVFAEDKFREKLSQAMAAVVHDYLRFNTVTLQSLIDRVMDMIEEYRHSDIAGTDNIQTIDMYASELSTQEDRFKQLNEKVDALIKKSQSIKKGENNVVTQPATHTENLSPEIPIESSCPECVCGKKLSKSGSYKGNPFLICDKRSGGCGNTYNLIAGLIVPSNKRRSHLSVPESEIGQVKTISSSLPIEVPIKEEVPIEVIQENYIKINAPKIIEYFENNKEITNSIVRDLCGLDISKAQYLLQTLVKKNFIRRIGSRKNSKYVHVEGSG